MFIRCDPYSESYNVAGAGNKYADADGKAEYENGKGRPFELSVTESCIAWGVLFGRAACGRPTLDRGFGSDNAEREPGISRRNVYDDKIQ